MRSTAAQPEDKGKFSLEGFGAKVNAHARADKSRRRVANIAEPLLAGLPNSGELRFSTKQFEALAHYCIAEPLREVKAAIERGTFKMGKLTFIADRTLRDGPVMTIAEFSRAARVPKETVRRHVVGQTFLRSIPKKSRKCFYVADLERLLAVSVG